MASGMPSAIGLQKCAPDRQVVCMAGGGGFTMLLGDLLTVLQENVPIKIVVIDNGKFGFIDIEQKSAGIEPIFTDLKNPDLGKVAEAMGLWGPCVTKAGELEEAVVDWFAQPGPALLDVKVNPMQLVMPPSPFVRPEAVVGMAVYTAKAMLHGKAVTSGKWLWRTSPDLHPASEELSGHESLRGWMRHSVCVFPTTAIRPSRHERRGLSLASR